MSDDLQARVDLSASEGLALSAEEGLLRVRLARIERSKPLVDEAMAALANDARLAEEGRAIEDALDAELALEFPDIRDTNERLAQF